MPFSTPLPLSGRPGNVMPGPARQCHGESPLTIQRGILFHFGEDDAGGTKLYPIGNISSTALNAKVCDNTNFENVCYRKVFLKMLVYAPTNGCIHQHGAQRVLFAE